MGGEPVNNPPYALLPVFPGLLVTQAVQSALDWLLRRLWWQHSRVYLVAGLPISEAFVRQASRWHGLEVVTVAATCRGDLRSLFPATMKRVVVDCYGRWEVEEVVR